MSASGHITAGETPLSSLVREVEEEIGLKIKETEFQLLGKFWRNEVYREDFIENELDYIYIINKDVDVSKVQIQKEEVENIAWIEMEAFKKMIDDGRVVKRKEVWKKFFEYLEDKNL